MKNSVEMQRYKNISEKSIPVCENTKELNAVVKHKYSDISEYFDDDLDLNNIQNIKEVKVTLEPCVKTIKISGVMMAELFLRKIWDNDLMNLQEQFYALFIDNKSMLRAYKLINRGTLTSTDIDIRMIFMLAFNCGCSGVIIAHNHPSGEARPSKNDKEITYRIKAALNFFMLNLVDHIILTVTDSYSFVDHGIINPEDFKYNKTPKLQCCTADWDSNIEKNQDLYYQKYLWDSLQKLQHGEITERQRKKRTKI